MARVTTRCAPDLSADERRAKYPESTRLKLILNDGRSAAGFCSIARGMPERPLSDADLLRKFLSAGAFAGVLLPQVEIGNFDPVAVLDLAVRAPAWPRPNNAPMRSGTA